MRACHRGSRFISWTEVEILLPEGPSPLPFHLRNGSLLRLGCVISPEPVPDSKHLLIGSRCRGELH